MSTKPHLLVVARVAIEGGWFIALADGDTPKTATELAKATGAQHLLIGESLSLQMARDKSSADTQLTTVRLMRVLTAGGIVTEVGPETYASTPVSKALTRPGVYDGIKHLYVLARQVFVRCV